MAAFSLLSELTSYASCKPDALISVLQTHVGYTRRVYYILFVFACDHCKAVCMCSLCAPLFMPLVPLSFIFPIPSPPYHSPPLSFWFLHLYRLPSPPLPFSPSHPLPLLPLPVCEQVVMVNPGWPCDRPSLLWLWSDWTPCQCSQASERWANSQCKRTLQWHFQAQRTDGKGNCIHYLTYYHTYRSDNMWLIIKCCRLDAWWRWTHLVTIIAFVSFNDLTVMFHGANRPLLYKGFKFQSDVAARQQELRPQW